MSEAIPRRIQPLATATLTLLSVATAIGMCRLFSDWAFLERMLIVVIGAHVVSMAIRATPLPAWAAIPLSLLCTIWLIGIVYHRDTTAAMLPTGDMIEALRADIRLVWEQFPKAVAPVPSAGSFAAVAGGFLALAAPISDAFAFRAFGRAEAVVPSAIVFIFVAALGTSRHRIAVAALWSGCALLLVAVLRAVHRGEAATWAGGMRPALAGIVPAAVAGAVIVAVTAAVVGPRLPGAGAEALVDTRNRANENTEVVSPLVDIKSQLVNRSNVLLFTVRTETPRYWRLIGLSDFDGRIWKPGDEGLRSRAPQPTVGQPVAAEITVERLGGVLLPAAYLPAQWSNAAFDWAPTSQALVYSGDRLPRDETVSILSYVHDLGPAELDTATSDRPPSNAFKAISSGLPDLAFRLTAEVTDQQPTPYRKALALQNWFRQDFTYDLDVQSGHSNDAMREFLEIRRGYCEQFAGTFAAMARIAGLPSRVAVGFTAGVATAGGTYEVRGRQAHAWPEIWFDGYGWVAFEPTPGRGQPGSEQVTGVPATQDTGEAEPNQASAPPTTLPGEDPAVVPPPTEAGASPSTTIAPIGASTSANTPSLGTWLAVLLAAAILIGWPVLMPRLIRDRRRRAAGEDPRDRVSSAWNRTRRALEPLADAPAGATPAQFASHVRTKVDVVNPDLVDHLAASVTEAVYGSASVGPEAADEAERGAASIIESLSQQQTLGQRVAAHYDPRRVP